MRQAALPLPGEEASPLRNGVDVIGQPQCDDVGWQPVDDRSCLLARAAVRLLHGDGVAGLALPVARKGDVVLLIQLSRGIVRDIQECHVFGGRQRRDAQCRGHYGEKKYAEHGPSSATEGTSSSLVGPLSPSKIMKVR